MRALVIDDSRTMRMIVGKILTEIGFETVEAGDGQEALNKLAETGPLDLAMVDWNMPEMNGFEFVKAVRAEPAYDNMKLMMVTTESEIEQVAQALEAGANEYAMKPFTKEVILEKLSLIGIEPVGT
ncbi:MAG: response regulator [Opitutaceae bacterium]